MTFRSSLLGLAAVLTLVACNSRSDEGDESAGALEQIPAIKGRVVARCTITTQGEGFFRADTLHCAADAPGDYPLPLAITLNAGNAHTSIGGGFLDRETMDKSFRPDQGYPFDIKLQVSATGSAPGVQGFEGSLEQTVTVPSLPTEPIVLTIPIDYWPVTLRATSRTFFSVPSRQEALDGTWTASSFGARNQHTVSLPSFFQSLDGAAPSTMFLAVKPGTTSLTARFQGDTDRTVTLEGPGSYVYGATGLAREGDAVVPGNRGPASEPSFANAEPEVFLGCYGGPDTIDGKPVVCSSRSIDGVEMQIFDVNVVGSDGEKQTSTAPFQSGEAGKCLAKPCTLEAEIMVSKVGTTFSVIIGKVVLPLDESATAENPIRFRLPFNLWRLTFDARGQKVAGMKFMTASKNGPPEWTADSQSQGLADAMVIPSQPIVFAAPFDATQVNGTLKYLDVNAGTATDVAFTVERGKNYMFSDDKHVVAAP